MVDTNLLLLPLVALLAFLVKGMTGFGPAIVLVSLGALFLPPQIVVVLSALLAGTAGLIMLYNDPMKGAGKLWIPLAVAMGIGSVIGGLSFNLILPQYFNIILAAVILALGVWFFVGRARKDEAGLSDTLPAVCSVKDLGVALVAGVLGGAIGVGGPPMVYYMGRRFARHSLRQALVPVFLAASAARFFTYSAAGMVDRQVMIYGLVSLPGLLLGVYLGNKALFKVSEVLFSRIVAVVLVAVAVRLAV